MSKFEVGDKLICKYDLPLSHVCKGGEYTFKGQDEKFTDFINLEEHEGRYSEDCFMLADTREVNELAWKHNRSALVYLMYLEGHKYIMCEVSDEDKDFDWMDSLDIVIITTVIENADGSLSFGDIEGNVHNAAQPIKGNGHVMGYDDYIKLKILGEEYDTHL